MLPKAEQPAISRWVELELVSALSRKIRENLLTREAANQIVACFQAHVDNNAFLLVPIEIGRRCG